MKSLSFLRSKRRIAAVTLTLLMLVPIAGSYSAALVAPGNVSLAVKTVEWMRNNHMGFIVAAAEDVWYTINAPPSGGPTLHSLPKQAKASPGPSGNKTGPGQAKQIPKNIQPVISPALPQEGVWAPAEQTYGGASPILTTTLRPDPLHPSVLAGLAWIDTPQTHLTLVPGLAEPESPVGSGPGQVPVQDRASLLATFNSGFKTKDGNGGFTANGKVYVQPKQGLGTIAIYRNGDVRIGTWGKEIGPSPEISYLRQNLPLLVDGGKVNPAERDPWPWVPNTVGNNVLVWRSGIGIDANGNLIYAAANGISENGLATLLQRAGAVRAMALDENTNWVDFFTYGAPGGNQPYKLLPSMANPMYRYLVPDQRDFFMVTR